jgi:hypothetical protein
LRGGAWYDNAYLMQVSCRIFAANTNNDRFENYGGRGARLAP